MVIPCEFKSRPSHHTMRDSVMVALMTLTHSVRVRILFPQPNKNLKVDRNLEVFVFCFGFKETLCLCGFRNTSCKSAAKRLCFLIVGSTFFMPELLKNIRFNQKMKPQNFTPTFRVNCLPFRVNSWTFRVKGMITHIKISNISQCEVTDIFPLY